MSRYYLIHSGKLSAAISQDFGSFEKFKQEFALKAIGVQGSGWAWLGLNLATKRLEISTTANQDPLLTTVPIVGLDVWEHAFYLM